MSVERVREATDAKRLLRALDWSMLVTVSHGGVKPEVELAGTRSTARRFRTVYRRASGVC